MELWGSVAEAYRDFAAAAGDCTTYRDWALAVAEDPEVQEWLGTLPKVKQQANLVFAAARWHGVPAPGPYAGLRAALLGDRGPVRDTIMARSTQTNEVGRLTALTPLLAQLSRQEGPLALVELGASAGLGQHPDRYDYVWRGAGKLRGSGGPTLTAAASGPLPVPAHHPRIADRSGVDLHPLDVTDADAMAWLATLVWPGQDQRLARLESAVALARREPPRLVAGDLVEQLPGLLERAGLHGTPVVLHSAVVAYLPPDRQAEFVSLMRAYVAEGRCRWVSNEAPTVLPGLRLAAGRPPGWFALALDGVQQAWAHQHGDGVEWLTPGRL